MLEKISGNAAIGFYIIKWKQKDYSNFRTLFVGCKAPIKPYISALELRRAHRLRPSSPRLPPRSGAHQAAGSTSLEPAASVLVTLTTAKNSKI
jgi:hypothetical protein